MNSYDNFQMQYDAVICYKNYTYFTCKCQLKFTRFFHQLKIIHCCTIRGILICTILYKKRSQDFLAVSLISPNIVRVNFMNSYPKWTFVCYTRGTMIHGLRIKDYQRKNNNIKLRFLMLYGLNVWQSIMNFYLRPKPIVALPYFLARTVVLLCKSRTLQRLHN